jgi:hypothetical protein
MKKIILCYLNIRENKMFLLNNARNLIRGQEWAVGIKKSESWVEVQVDPLQLQTVSILDGCEKHLNFFGYSPNSIVVSSQLRSVEKSYFTFWARKYEMDLISISGVEPNVVILADLGEADEWKFLLAGTL